MKSNVNLAPMTAKGRFKVLVVENGKVVEERPWQNNLILDQGMDMIATMNWASAFAVCVAGTGNTVTVRSSNPITASQSGAAVVASQNFFSAQDVGRTLNFAGGLFGKIVGYTDAQNVTLNVSQSVGSSQFAVFYTEQVGLANEVKRHSTYLTGSGNCGTTRNGSIFTMQRTYDFSAESQQTVYSELGWSNSGSAGNNLFSRVLLSSTVTVQIGQQLRVVYSLAVTISPTTTQSGTATVTGWPVAPSTLMTGQYAIQFAGISSVDTSGNSTSWGGSGAGAAGSVNEPASSGTLFLSTDTAAPGAFENNTTRQTNGVTKAFSLLAYVSGNYYRDRSAVFAVGEANRNDWTSMGIGNGGGGAVGFVFVFTEPQTKANTNTLTLTFRSSWGRTLVNP